MIRAVFAWLFYLTLAGCADTTSGAEHSCCGVTGQKVDCGRQFEEELGNLGRSKLGSAMSGGSSGQLPEGLSEQASFVRYLSSGEMWESRSQDLFVLKVLNIVWRMLQAETTRSSVVFKEEDLSLVEQSPTMAEALHCSILYGCMEKYGHVKPNLLSSMGFNMFRNVNSKQMLSESKWAATREVCHGCLEVLMGSLGISCEVEPYMWKYLNGYNDGKASRLYNYVEKALPPHLKKKEFYKKYCYRPYNKGECKRVVPYPVFYSRFMLANRLRMRRTPAGYPSGSVAFNKADFLAWMFTDDNFTLHGTERIVDDCPLREELMDMLTEPTSQSDESETAGGDSSTDDPNAAELPGEEHDPIRVYGPTMDNVHPAYENEGGFR